MKNKAGLLLFAMILLLVQTFTGYGQNASTSAWEWIGPPGAKLQTLVRNPVNGDLIAGTYGVPTQVYRSTDGGALWNRISEIQNYLYFLVMSPKNPQHLIGSYWNLWAWTRNQTTDSNNCQIVKSTDGGVTWKEKNFRGEMGWTYESFKMCTDEAGTIAISGHCYQEGSPSVPKQPFYCKSIDEGETWTIRRFANVKTAGVLTWKVMATDPSNANTLYAGGYEVIGGFAYMILFRSTDGGSSWTNIRQDGMWGKAYDILVDPKSANRVYLATDQGVYRSVDRGMTWVHSKNEMGTVDATELCIDPVNSSVMYAYGTGNGLFQSTNGGVNWRPLHSQIWGAVKKVVLNASQDYKIHAATTIGHYRSDNAGQDWTLSNAGMNGTDIEALKCVPSDPGVVYVSSVGGGLYRANNMLGSVPAGGFNWEKLPDYFYSDNVANLEISSGSPAKIYIQEGPTGSMRRLAMSSNGGTSWNQIDNSFEGFNLRSAGTLYNVGSALYQVAPGKRMAMRKSTNDGVTWDQVQLSDSLSIGYAVLPNPVNDSIIYVGGYYSGADQYNRILLFKSTDKGNTWRKLDLSRLTFEGVGVVHALESDRANPNRIFAGVAGGILLSTDAGVTWSKSLDGPYSVANIIINPSDPNTVYANGGNYGVLKISRDGGKTWADFNEGLPYVYVKSMDLDPVNQVLYVGTFGRGVFRRKLSGGGGGMVPSSSWGYKSNTGKSAAISVPPTVNPTIGTRPLTNDDAVGAFFWRGDSLVCAGYGNWKIGQGIAAMTIWGDDSQTSVKDGFSEGEPLKFRIWDGLTGKVHDAGATFTTGNTTFTNNGQYALRTLAANPDCVHRIVLPQGASIISSYVAPGTTSVASLCANIASKIQFLKNNAGEVFWPAAGFNNIGEWNSLMGYIIKMNAQDTLTVSGLESVPLQNPIPLLQGWSIVAYLRNSPMRADSALASVSNSLVIAKNGAGQVYWPAYGTNTIGAMRPGQGYQIYLREGATLTYPVNAGGAPLNQLTKTQASSFGDLPEPKHLLPVSTRTGVNATLLVECGGSKNGDEIGIWTASGILVGSAVVQNGRAVPTLWGDDSSTPDKEGASEQELLMFRLWSSADEQIRPLAIESIENVVRDCGDGTTLRFKANGVSVIHTDDRQSEVPETFELAQNYPNPFNPATTISYQLPAPSAVEGSAVSSVTLRIYDVLGREVATLVDENQKPGGYSVRWDASSMPSGVYMVRLSAGNNVASRKMILMK